jgi:hypothetical protein
VIFFALAACGSIEATAAHVGASPLASITRTPAEPDVRGTVVEVLPAGGYAYLRVEDRWFATLDRGLTVGDPVTLDPIGRADTFYSRRTGRTFDALWFASVASSGGPDGAAAPPPATSQ